MSTYQILFKVVALVLICIQTNLFAPKGGVLYGECRLGRDGTLKDCTWSWSDGGNTHGNNGADNWGNGSSHSNGSSSGNGFNSFGSSGYGSGSSSSLSSGLKAQVEQITQQTLCEYYVTDNGNLCTQQERFQAMRAIAELQMAELSGAMTRVRAEEIADLFGRMGIDFGYAMAKEEIIAECDLAAKDIKREVTAKLLSSLSRLNSIKNGTCQPPANAQSYTALNGRVCTKEQALETAQILQQLREDVALGRITAAQQARVILSMSAAGVPLICATAVLKTAKDQAQKAIEAIKAEIIGKNLALPGIDAVIMASVEGMSRSDEGNVTSLAQEVMGTVFLGREKDFYDRAEHFTKRCLRQNEGRHLCFSMNQANGAASRLAAAGPAALAAHWAQVDHDIRVNQASGAC